MEHAQFPNCSTEFVPFIPFIESVSLLVCMSCYGKITQARHKGIRFQFRRIEKFKDTVSARLAPSQLHKRHLLCTLPQWLLHHCNPEHSSAPKFITQISAPLFTPQSLCLEDSDHFSCSTATNVLFIMAILKMLVELDVVTHL